MWRFCYNPIGNEINFVCQVRVSQKYHCACTAKFSNNANVSQQYEEKRFTLTTLLESLESHSSIWTGGFTSNG